MSIEDGLRDGMKPPDTVILENRKIKGVGVGDIILVDGIPKRVTGFTEPEDTKSCDFTQAPLSSIEFGEYQRREHAITKMIDQQIVGDPNSDIDLAECRKYWEKIYDEAEKSGKTFQMVCAETDYLKFMAYVLKAKDELSIAEKQRDFATNTVECRVLESVVEKRRMNLMHMEYRCDKAKEAIDSY